MDTHARFLSPAFSYSLRHPACGEINGERITTSDRGNRTHLKNSGTIPSCARTSERYEAREAKKIFILFPSQAENRSESDTVQFLRAFRQSYRAQKSSDSPPENFCSYSEGCRGTHGARARRRRDARTFFYLSLCAHDRAEGNVVSKQRSRGRAAAERESRFLCGA